MKSLSFLNLSLFTLAPLLFQGGVDDIETRNIRRVGVLTL